MGTIHEWSNLFKFNVEMGPLLFEIFLDDGFFRPDHDWSGFHHNHAAYEIQFILKGPCLLYVEDTYQEVEEAGFCVIPPHIYHSQISHSHVHVQKCCFKFNYKWTNNRNRDFPEVEAATLRHIMNGMSFFKQKDVGDPIRLLNEIKNELHMKPVGYVSKIQSLFTQILIDVIRSSPHNPIDSYDMPKKTIDEQRMNLIDAFFGGNYSGNLKDDDLASLLSVSNRQLNRILHELYNASFRQKLLETRMKVSMDMLKNTNLPIKEIARQVGYQSIENFHVIFKAKTGTTPAAFRKQLRPSQG